MTGADRPQFLAVTNEGLWALGSGDDITRLELVPADEPNSLHRVVGGTVPFEVGELYVRDDTAGISVHARCPTALQVGQERVSAWHEARRRMFDLDPLQLALLCGLRDQPVVDPLHPLVEELIDAGVLAAVDSTEGFDRSGYLRPVAADPAVDEIGPPSVDGLVPVYSVCASHIAGIPLGLGMLHAAVRDHRGGELLQTFDLRPIRRETATTVAELEVAGVPAVLLFSNYLWSLEPNLELSARSAALRPGSVCIHGGPSTPRYGGDVEAFLDAHPEVDILVAGEGEVTIVEVLAALGADLDVDRVAGIAGTVVRCSDGSIRTGPQRPRVQDLATLDSAYLSGRFDHLDGGLLDLMPIETNRGCPYGCTFCDWGSATNSRIRTFPLDRVFAELDWIAERRVGTIFITDANFGVLPRDLEIAEHIAELRRSSGFPHAVLVSFAKNQTLRAAQIVKTWIDAEIATEGSVALQTTDDETLRIINRKNIRVERYDELTEEFRKLGLPLAVDLMLGLPGSTVASFAADLQRCIDRDLTARIYPTVVLANSPMNDPQYRAANRIRVDDRGIVVASASFDDDAYAQMLRLRRIYRAGDHFGLMRHVARWCQLERGLPAVELYMAVDDAVRADPGDWPSLRWMAQHFARFTVPPPSWPQFYDECRRLVRDGCGVQLDDGFETVLEVQRSVVPSPGRRLPVTVELDHDYVAWFHQPVGDARPLVEFPPGRLRVADPRAICTSRVGSHLRFHSHHDVDNVMFNEFWIADDWELQSDVMRQLPQVSTDRDGR